jgi:hypothetical protein
MENTKSNSQLNGIIQQVNSNSTCWVGHFFGEENNRMSGQTFLCPSEGELESIEVFSSYVANGDSVEMTIHAFDIENHSWGPILETAVVKFSKNDTGKWISFPVKGLHLQKGKTYGFCLKTDQGLVGVGEAAGNYNNLQSNGGQEWLANSKDQAGKFYSYLSLAYKIALRA